MPQQLVPSTIRKEQKKLGLVGRSGLAPSKYPIGVLETCTTSRERFPKDRRSGFTSMTIPHSCLSTTERRSLLIIGGQESFRGQWPLTSPCFTLSPPGWHQTHSTYILHHYAIECSHSYDSKWVGGYKNIKDM